MIRVDSVNNFKDPLLKDRWNSLLDVSDNSFIFQRYEWAKNCWEYFARPNEELSILLVYDDEDLLAVFPLKIIKTKLLGCRDFSIVGSSVYDYFDFIIKNGFERRVIDAVFAYLRKNYGFFRLALKNITVNSASRIYLSELLNERMIDGCIYCEDTVPLMRLPHSKEGLRLKIKKSLKADISRNLKRLHSLGSLSLRHCDDLDKAVQMLDFFFRQHKERWESVGGYSGYIFKERQQFTKDLMRDLFVSKIANVYVLLLGSEPIATCLALSFKDRFVYLSPTFSTRYSSYSPGKILLYELVNHCIMHDIKIFDFGIGMEAYKLQWPCEISMLHTFFIYSARRKLSILPMKCCTELKMFYNLKMLPVMRRCKIAVGIWRFLRRKQNLFK